MNTNSKWSKKYWVDFAERLGATLGAVFLGFFGQDTLVGNVDWGNAGHIILTVGVITVVKLLMANLKDPESGGSLVNHPPGPDVQL